MFCKKCGTEQKEGQKFCPKCGEPFLDENGKPYLKGFRKDMQDAKDKLTSKVDELTQQGKKLIDEKVQPQLNEKIEELRNANWDKKKEQTTSIIKEFINNPNRIRIATIVVVCLFALLTLMKVGFSASILWYILMVIMLYVAFMGIPKLRMEGLKLQYVTTIFCFVLMLIVGFGVLKSNTDNSMGILRIESKNEGPHEVCIYNDVEIVGNNRGYLRYDIIINEGNCGVHKTSQGGEIATDIITIPKGKKWKFDREESTCEGDFYTPSIYQYVSGDDEDLDNYRHYVAKKSSNIPIFRGGDKIVVCVPLTILNGQRMKLHLKVYFIETDDEFAM